MTKLVRALFSSLLLFYASSAPASRYQAEEPLQPPRQPVRISENQSPAEYFGEFKTLADRKQATPEQLKILWKFRYLKGIERDFLETQAKQLKVLLDDSWSSSLEAWRLYFGHRENGRGRFVVKYLPWALPLASLLTSFASFTQFPYRVPEGCKIVYGAFSRVPCGGEAGPICPATELAASLPASQVFRFSDDALRVASLYAVNVVGTISMGIWLKDRSCGPRESWWDEDRGYYTVNGSDDYLKEIDEFRSKQRPAVIVLGILTIGIDAVGIPALYRTLTGTIANTMKEITWSAYNSRNIGPDCFQLINKVTALRCNMTLPMHYLKHADFYTATTRVVQATIMDVLPYTIPVFITLLKLMIFMFKLF